MFGISTTRKGKVLSFGAKTGSVPTDIYRSRRYLSNFNMDTSSRCSSRKSMKKASNNALDSPLEMSKNSELSRDEVGQLPTVDDTASLETLTNDEILKAVEKDENEDVDESDKSDEGLSHSEAYSCAKVLFNWMEQQNEFSATDWMVIRQIRDVAALKSLSPSKQKFIKDYLEYDRN
ncbi:hypothetical protein T11_15086 [Trichinella zimbabwensis]|uniref:Jerky-like protein-like n=1 Tax=Trichinella zimbabwensis TaxID=268475 RepID=A0A0V1H224_9BILA|nr:hypothetical protein T11_15086 [Trichinella zimbabwensis]